MLWPSLLGALFVGRVTSVVGRSWRFATTGPGVPDAPFHHHFELVGWAETTVDHPVLAASPRSRAVASRCSPASGLSAHR